MRMDLHHNIKLVPALAPQTFAATADTAILDMKGFQSNELAINVGAFTFTGVNSLSIVLHESDVANFATSNVVAAEDLLGADITLDDAADASKTFRQGYIGVKRYLRATVTEGGTVSVLLSAMFIQGHPVDAATIEQDAVN